MTTLELARQRRLSLIGNTFRAVQTASEDAISSLTHPLASNLATAEVMGLGDLLGRAQRSVIRRRQYAAFRVF